MTQFNRKSMTGGARIAPPLVIVLASLLSAVVPASGHAILVSRGTAVAYSDRLVIEIECSAEDFFHYYRLPVKDGFVETSDVRSAVERHGAYLLERFTIFDESGLRLPGRVEGVQSKLPGGDRIEFLALRELRVTYQLEYPLSHPARFLTFQQRFGDDSAALPSQLVLTVRSADAEHGRFIQLTNGGNHETVDLAPGGGGLGATDSAPEKRVAGNRVPESEMGADRFKEVYGFVRRDSAGGVVVDLYIPFPLMETFVSITRQNENVLAPAEMKAAIERFGRFVESRPPLGFTGRDDSSACTPACKWVGILAPTDNRLDDSRDGNQPICAWSARVAIRLRCQKSAMISMIFKMFNASVVNATVWQVVDGAACCEETLMPGDAEVRLK